MPVVLWVVLSLSVYCVIAICGCRMAKKPKGPDYAAAGAWFAAMFGLASWDIELCIDENPPAWTDGVGGRPMGMAEINVAREKVRIWVSESRSEEDSGALSTFFHEMCHVLAAKAGIKNDSGPRREFVWNRMGDLLAKAFEAGVEV